MGGYREVMGPSIREGTRGPKNLTSYKKHPLTLLKLGGDLHVPTLRLDHIYLKFCGSTISLESRVLEEGIRRWVDFDRRWGGDGESDRVSALGRTGRCTAAQELLLLASLSRAFWH